MVKQQFIGLDYSLISPGICLIKEGTTKWISIYSDKSEEHHKHLSKKDGPFKVLSDSENIEIILRDKTDKHGSTYSETERNKMLSATQEVEFLVQQIKKHTDGFSGETYLAMEGISFGSKGNTLIDISMSTGMLRSRIISEILEGQADRFFVFSPGTIKKYALKGNAKKDELYDAIIEKEGLNQLELVKEMAAYKDRWVSPGGIVKKPLDDLVDATWIAHLLRDVIVDGLAAEEAKKVKKTKKK